MNEYAGVFRLLAVVPVWATALFVFAVGTCIGLLFVIADKTTGVYFNVSYSGVVGDLCLSIVVLIGATVIQRGAPLPSWFAGMWPQVWWFVISLAVGIVLVTVTTPWPHAEWPDRYHNFVVVMLYLFLVPLVFLAIVYNGNTLEVITSCGLLAIWVALVVYDFKDGRIDQRWWIAERCGVYFEQGRILRLPTNRK